MVIGRAAALLLLRMGISEIEADLLSRRALSLLSEHSITPAALETVDKIGCMTEDILQDVSDPDQAYAILSERRVKALLR